jgi:DNA-binding MarR family transcriptional regulator
MENSILVQTFGNTHQLKVLGFFLEHPVHQFRVTTLSEYLDIARDTVKRDLDSYVSVGYISRASSRGPYRLSLNNRMVQTLMKCVSQIAESQAVEDEEITVKSPSYFATETRAIAGAARMSIAGAA